MSRDILSVIQQEKLVAIVRGTAQTPVVKIAEALHAGGVKFLEVTCNTPGVVDMIRAAAEAMGDRMLIGAGTVVTRELAKEVLAAGARYIIAPDVNPEVVTYCLEGGVPVIPGAATPTEVLTAKRLGARMVKVFPAGPLGCAYIKQMRGPISDVPMVAVGGVTLDNVADFLAAGCVAVAAGSALVNKDLVARGDWEGLADFAREWRNRVSGLGSRA